MCGVLIVKCCDKEDRLYSDDECDDDDNMFIDEDKLNEDTFCAKESINKHKSQ